MHMQPNITSRYFFLTQFRADEPRKDNAADVGQKYAGVAGTAVAEALLVLPRLALGTRTLRLSATAPQRLLQPKSMDILDRGLVGCVALAVGKLMQFSGAGVGAAIGVVASALGALVGCGGAHWIDLAAGKGWQLGTVVASCVMAASELARHAEFPVAWILFTGVKLLEHSGSILGQIVDAATTAPPFSQIG
jgi:hypothetical protein